MAHHGVVRKRSFFSRYLPEQLGWSPCSKCRGSLGESKHILILKLVLNYVYSVFLGFMLLCISFPPFHFLPPFLLPPFRSLFFIFSLLPTTFFMLFFHFSLCRFLPVFLSCLTCHSLLLSPPFFSFLLLLSPSSFSLSIFFLLPSSSFLFSISHYFIAFSCVFFLLFAIPLYFVSSPLFALSLLFPLSLSPSCFPHSSPRKVRKLLGYCPLVSAEEEPSCVLHDRGLSAVVALGLFAVESRLQVLIFRSVRWALLQV